VQVDFPGSPVSLHRDVLDPDFIRAALLSLGGHLLILAVVVFLGARDWSESPARAPVYGVRIHKAAPGSLLMRQGPLGGSGAGPVAPALVKKPAPVKKPVPVKKPEPVAKKPVPVKKPEPVAKKAVPVKKPEPVAKKPVPVKKPEPVAKKPVPVKKPEPVAKKPVPVKKPEPVAKKPVAVKKPEPVAKKAAPVAAVLENIPASEPAPKTTPPAAQSEDGSKLTTLSGAAGDAPATGPAGVATGDLLQGVEFLRYYNTLIDTLRRNWVWAGDAGAGLSVSVGFSVRPDGSLAAVRLLSESGNAGFDRSVENAVRSAGMIEPPPVRYRKEFSEVIIRFNSDDLANGAGARKR
jgi:TonB family protein